MCKERTRFVRIREAIVEDSGARGRIQLVMLCHVLENKGEQGDQRQRESR